MKKRAISLVVVALMFMSVSFVSAADPVCDIDVTLLNQDPYPAVPGEYVKVVFQLDGIEGDACGRVRFELLEDFPFSLDPGVPSTVEVVSGTQLRNFGSTFLIPYEIRVSPDAVEGANPIEARISRDKPGVSTVKEIAQFNIEVQEVSTDFEVTVEDYNPVSGVVTFEIINVGENDVEALTIDVPSQENMKVIGTSREIIGDLDSGEDTTFRFITSQLNDGDIELQIRYNDPIGERRVLTQTVSFDSAPFVVASANGSSSRGAIFYVVLIVIIALIVWFIWRRRKKRKERLEKFNKGKR